ncbi:YjbH domain-containing protein [Phaeovulum sp.]|uniref:YjbH domain-containing protein n=1 Tax=Phaeovulum sp. TaxID=2934796 RepID=UPI0039E6FCE1
MPGKRRISRNIVAVAVAASVAAPAGMAEPMIGNARGTFGLPGLVDMPTAESLPDGLLGASLFWMGDTQRTTFSFQITPRMTAALRYSRVPGFGSGGDELKDRSFDFHYRFLDETDWRPALAVGVRDFIGTGAYSSEYIVATKTFGDSVRATAGLGWGRLGSKDGWGSPFGDRPPLNYDKIGKLNSSQWFRGEVAPFFGLAWAPNDKLTLKAEYSSDAFVQEVAMGELERDSSVNFGVDYRFNSLASVSAYYLYGSEVGFQFNLSIDPRKPPFPSGIEKAPLPVRPRPAPAMDPEGWSGAWTADSSVHPGVQRVVAESLKKDGQILESMSLSATRAEVRVRNETYDARPQAIGHTARILTRALPPSVETIVVTNVARGMPVSSVAFKRSDLERLENENSNAILQRATLTDAVAGPDDGLRMTEGLFPRFQWAMTPYGEMSWYDDDDSVRADIGVSLAAKYEFAPGLVLSGTVRQKVLGNLDDSTHVSNSKVYPVRSDLVEYRKHGDLAIQNLTLAWYARPAENLYSRVTVGLLERMYGGISGELLWKPVDSRLALGAELNYVKQRDFDQQFDFRDYDVVTGHASAYYDLGKGFTGQLDVGRYLDEDWGTTLSIDREFANGWRVGAFATVTDMSSDDFGDGSFDKGVRVSFPVAWITGRPTVSKFKTTIRPVTGDGGARVDIDGRLYETIRDSHTGELYEGWGRFWR